MGLRTAANRALTGRTGPMVVLAGNVINYSAVVLSTNANVYFMRRSELETGIIVRDENTGTEFGSSKIAAQSAITSTMFSRLVYCIPIFFVPAIWNLGLKSLKLMPKPKTPLGTFVEVLGVALGLGIAMPVNCALYPQTSEIEVSKLEPEIQEAAKAKGLSVLQYNKGL